jgi:hypothetical protein
MPADAPVTSAHDLSAIRSLLSAVTMSLQGESIGHPAVKASRQK